MLRADDSWRFLLPSHSIYAESTTIEKENRLLFPVPFSIMNHIIPQLAFHSKQVWELACPPRSDCCTAPLERVKDELLLCTACGKLCDERDLQSLACPL